MALDGYQNVLGVTGHRPDKLGVPYDCDDPTKYPMFVNAMLGFKRVVERIKPDLVITGMAQGFDQWVADACVALSVPFAAYVPFDGQDAKWSESGRKEYARLLGLARLVRTVTPGGYAAWKMHVRNQAIVDDCHTLAACFYSGPGGTEQCVRYAIRTDRDLCIIDPREAPKEENG